MAYLLSDESLSEVTPAGLHPESPAPSATFCNVLQGQKDRNFRYPKNHALTWDPKASNHLCRVAPRFFPLSRCEANPVPQENSMNPAAVAPSSQVDQLIARLQAARAQSRQLFKIVRPS